MAHSIELLPDDATTTRLRTQWARLAEHGLPSAQRLDSTTNRPHVTLIAAGRIAPAADRVLATSSEHLPIPCELGAPVVFGRGSRLTLARLVVPTSTLLALHRMTSELLTEFVERPDGEPGAFDHVSPDHWTPHVTLARRMTPTQIGVALDLLDTTEPAGTFTAIRRWDSDAATERVFTSGVDHHLSS